MIEFTPPSFVNECDPDTIHEKMMNSLPPDIDNMPGGFPWDFTRPTANEKSELIQVHLVQTLMLMHPMWAWDEWLDYHASVAGLSRRTASEAMGILTVEGIAETIIPSGSVFVTPSINNEPSIEYVTKETYTIDESGVAEIEIIAVEAGTHSNVPANTVTLMAVPIKGVTKVWNEHSVTGGTEEEDDDTLRVRIQERNETANTSYVGNESDYIRWAKEIKGVGSVIVVPDWDGKGTVKLVVMDINGSPANQHILDEIYDFIMSPNDKIERKAPIGAFLDVVAPDAIEVSYSCNIILEPGYSREEVEKGFQENIKKYYETAKNEGVLKYIKVGSVLSETYGVNDFSDLVINGQMKNIVIDQDEYPETVSIEFNTD